MINGTSTVLGSDNPEGTPQCRWRSKWRNVRATEQESLSWSKEESGGVSHSMGDSKSIVFGQGPLEGCLPMGYFCLEWL